MPRQATAIEFLPAIASVERPEWQRMLSRSDTNVVFLTREWQQTWWESYEKGTLLLAAARQDGRIVALAPLFAEHGMVYFVGSGGCGSDYLDFVGDISAPDTLDGLLAAVRDRVRHFVGFRFFRVPDASRTGALLRGAAGRLALDLCDEGELPAPVLDLHAPWAIELILSKKTLRQAERFLERTGTLTVQEARTGGDILPHLDGFFAQHIERWRPTPSPSLFLEAQHREFYRKLVQEASDAGWLRFARLEWQDRTIAAHFGFCYEGRYLYYKPTFSTDLARHSPGQLLLRKLVQSAMADHATLFDFGVGNEAYKGRFATATPFVRTWGLYAPGRAPQ
jgi:CelD/BcsL family acetyltransferase involved in cellulose biosynthesis